MEAEKAGPEYPSGFRRIDRSRVIINPSPFTINLEPLTLNREPLTLNH